MKNIVAFIVFGLLFSVGLTAYAQTPDEMTPAEETVCDGLEGAAFGLCNAYCEAMDCDSDEGYNQHPIACDKVFANYEKKTGGEVPPCVEPVCTAEAIDICGAEERTCPDGSVICTKDYVCGSRGCICVGNLCRIIIP